MCNATDPEIVSQFIRQAKSLCLLLGQQHQLNTDCCVLNSSLSEKPDHQEKRIKKLVEVQLEIKQQHQRLLELENKDTPLGVTRLLGKEYAQKPAIYHALTLLLLAKLNHSLQRHISCVGELIELAAGVCGEDAIELRNAIRAEGVLFPHLNMGEMAAGDCLENISCTLSDYAYCECLWIPQNDFERSCATLNRLNKSLAFPHRYGR